MTSKKHYVAIAERLSEMGQSIEQGFQAGRHDLIFRNGYLWALSDITVELAIIFKDDNPNFDQEKFIAAAEVD